LSNAPDRPALTLGCAAVASTPDEFAAWIRAEIPKWAKVVRDANIAPQ
jgi:hypothetical protein